MNPSDSAGLRSCIRPLFLHLGAWKQGTGEELLGRRGGLPQRFRISRTDQIVSWWNTAAERGRNVSCYQERAILIQYCPPPWTPRVIYAFARVTHRYTWREPRNRG